jgi:hypothetical protein
VHETQCKKLQSEFNSKEDKLSRKIKEVSKQRDVASSDNEKLAIIINIKEEKETELNKNFRANYVKKTK